MADSDDKTPITVNCILHDKVIETLVDTGSSCNLISAKFCKHYEDKEFPPLKTTGNLKVSLLGIAKIDIHLGGCKLNLEAYVIENIEYGIL